eukprot:SAG31_NODE_10666_length_1112_cov_0.931885_1_plen_134_part_00
MLFKAFSLRPALGCGWWGTRPVLEAAGTSLQRAALTGNWSFNETLSYLAPLLPTKQYTLFDPGEASETAAYTTAAAVGALPIALADEPLALANGFQMLHDLRGQVRVPVDSLESIFYSIFLSSNSLFQNAGIP